MRLFFLAGLSCFLMASHTIGSDPELVWPGYAPGESTKATGTVQPFRANENPPITRVTNISQPTFTVHLAEKPNGSAAIILPGGGFAKVVPDKEGTEAADWLNRHGVSAFVLSYRTAERDSPIPGWRKALQDAQRTVALIRSQADRWKIDRNKIGIVAFSAGGQVGARLLCDGGKLAYEKIDEIDTVSHRPDFAILVYPWNIYDTDNDKLIEGLEVPKDCPPTYLVHTHDDRSSSLGTVLFYYKLKQFEIPSELHVYGNGGHGYGMRAVKGSEIATWIDHATHWLGTQNFADAK